MPKLRAVKANVLLAGSLLAGAASGLDAQVISIGRVEGTVARVGQSRTFRTASVEAVRLDSLDTAPALAHTVVPDERGRFHLDSLPVGRYMLQLSSPSLDSLGLALPPSELKVLAGITVHADLALPQGSAVRDAVCAGVPLGRGKGVVAGRVVDADTELPLANADVVVGWNEIVVDARAQSHNEERAGVIRTGPRGEYRLCGVPTGSWLLIQIQTGNRGSGAARVTVSDEEGAIAHNLSLSMRAAPTFAALDSVDAAAKPSEMGFLKGAASLAGVVRTAAGLPLAEAEIRIVNAKSVATTDAAGKFHLDELPSGTQILSVRRLGYTGLEVNVDLRSGSGVTRDFTLRRIVSLDSVRITAMRTKYPDFESHRTTNTFGKFFTEVELRAFKGQEMSDFVAQIGGFEVLERGYDARVISGNADRRRGCHEANVVIDGVPQTGINFLPPSLIAAMEVYRDGTTAPSVYRSECGVILLWTKKYSAAPKADSPDDPR